MKTKKPVLVVSLILLCVGFADAQNHSRLIQIKKVYIGDLGKEEGSDLVREKIRIRLMKSDRFTVVETQEAADAVLTGVAGVVRREGGQYEPIPQVMCLGAEGRALLESACYDLLISDPKKQFGSSSISVVLASEVPPAELQPRLSINF